MTPTFGLATLLAKLAIAAFCCLAPGIALLVVLERRLPMARARRWPVLVAGVLLAAAFATALWRVLLVGLGLSDMPVFHWKDVGVDFSSQLAWLALLAVWRVADGAAVRQGEVLCDLETDKVNVEMEAPADAAVGGAPPSAEGPDED